ncbi:MAG: helix-hairpin-helix domain-containing protein [Acidobacteriota bacterium]|jgi:predicted DNA-binding helix-hairpin-helix protein|nr:helix-hairpin-helix domain-containing protein [Acidobacteriota bacterium]
MTALISAPDTRRKLEILSADAQYDLSCACAPTKAEHRRRGAEGWIYPATLQNGGSSLIFKTLLSNVCSNDCRYCPLKAQRDIRRCTLGEEEVAGAFLDYYRRGEVFGLFLTSGVLGTPDATMERLNGVARLLRRRRFRGYIHLKVIPGASDAAIEEAVSLSSAVSLNIETPGARHLAQLSQRKRFLEDIVAPIKLISRLTGKGGRFAGVKQTTQFIVGATEETDAEIVKYTWGLYDRLRLDRVYFSAHQQPSPRRLGGDAVATVVGGGDAVKAGAASSALEAAYVREHRLYQVDFLMRRYGFTETDIGFDQAGFLPLGVDPKEDWARRHPEFFPVNVNRASRLQLMRVPGIGEVTARRILEHRKNSRLRDLGGLGRMDSRLLRASEFVCY